MSGQEWNFFSKESGSWEAFCIDKFFVAMIRTRWSDQHDKSYLSLLNLSRVKEISTYLKKSAESVGSDFLKSSVFPLYLEIKQKLARNSECG
jgi:hypothetical protein